MELIARDMKSMGSYLARNISFEGVEYETLQHDLSPIQRKCTISIAGMANRTEQYK